MHRRRCREYAYLGVGAFLMLLLFFIVSALHLRFLHLPAIQSEHQDACMVVHAFVVLITVLLAMAVFYGRRWLRASIPPHQGSVSTWTMGSQPHTLGMGTIWCDVVCSVPTFGIVCSAYCMLYGVCYMVC